MNPEKTIYHEEHEVHEGLSIRFFFVLFVCFVVKRGC